MEVGAGEGIVQIIIKIFEHFVVLACCSYRNSIRVRKIALRLNCQMKNSSF